MQKIIILFLSIPFFFVRADVSQKVETLNRAVKAVGSSLKECNNCEAAVQEDVGSLMKSCVDTICTSGYLGIQGVEEKIIQNKDIHLQSFQTEFAPLIEDYIKKNKEGGLADVQGFLDWIQENPDPVFENPFLIKFGEVLSIIGDLSKFSFSDNGRSGFDFDRQASRSSFPDLSEEEFSKKLRFAEKTMNLIYPILEISGSVELLSALDRDRVLTQIEETVRENRKSVESLKKNSDSRFLLEALNFNEESLVSSDSLFPNGVMNVTVVERFFRNSMILKLSAFSLKDPELSRLVDTSPRKLSQFPGVDLEKIKKEAKDSLKSQNSRLEEKKNKLWLGCFHNYTQAMEGLLSKEEAQKNYPRILKVQADFFKILKGVLSEGSGKSLEKKWSSWKPQLTSDRESYLKGLKIALQEEARLVGPSIPAHEDQKKNYFSAMVIFNSDDEDDDDDDYLSCFDTSINLIPDAAPVKGDYYAIGPITAGHGRFAEGIIQHELGHKVMRILEGSSLSSETQKWFEGARSCLSQMSMEEDDKTLREDWADLIATISPASSNFLCTLIRQVDYQDLSLNNSDKTDPHSADLFRLLHVQYVNTGEIPQVCQRALRAKGESANFKNCLSTGAR